jgi:ketosteroid isomerase-like protein
MSSQDEHRAIIERFYSGFAARDTDAMGACYHPEIHFSDPVFPDLHGPEVINMWRTLSGRAADMAVTFRDVRADDTTGSAHWTATYTFSGTGRHVVNEIDASFRFADGLIIRHVDSFDFWRWSRMALGTSGLLLGWTPYLRSKVRQRSAKLIAGGRPA